MSPVTHPSQTRITPLECFWGDTHLHTTNSLDARSLGVTLTPEDAYRFARGDQVTSSTGQAARLSRPLDILVVSDHSDLMGIIDQLIRRNPKLMAHEEAKQLSDGDKWHRNVLYRDGADVASQMRPYTAIESLNPQDLWKWMARYEQTTGGRVLALAHNGNLSNGQMFPVETNPEANTATDAEYVRTRVRCEPLLHTIFLPR